MALKKKNMAYYGIGTYGIDNGRGKYRKCGVRVTYNMKQITEVGKNSKQG